jgi:hypothetical protein
MTGILNALIAGVSGAVKDTYFNLVSLLLPGNGTNGAQNNTFLDSSTNNFTITRNGDTTQGTFSPFSQTGWGNYFDGTGDYLTASSNAAFGMGSGDYTIECWLYITTTSTYDAIYSTTGTTSSDIQVQLNNRLLRVSSYTAQTVIANAGTEVSLNTWTHVAFCRSGTTLKLFKNGVEVGSGTDSTTWATGAIEIGRVFGSQMLNGYMSNLRVVKGTALYTGGFTPSTTPLTAITNTSLLTCQSNRFIDNSSSPKTITVNGNTSVTPFSPFAPTSSYSAAAVGGSGYFDGTGDYLVSPTNAAFGFATGDFTVQCWFYLTAAITGNAKGIFQVASAVNGTVTGYGIGIKNTQTIQYYAGATFNDSSTAITTNQWYHLTMTRSSGTVYVYLNGTLIQNGSKADTQNITSGETTVGIWFDKASGFEFPGYISGFRVVKGSVISEVVPTAPPTAVSGTSLLLNFTNAGVVDATAKNVLETEGNAQISTTQSKWGGGSISFDGTGDYLKAPDDVNWDLGSSNFTIEAWVYPTASPLQPILIGQWTSSYAWLLTLSNDSNRYLRGILYNGSFNDYVSTSPLQLNNWNHCAMVRESNTVSLYLNGSRVYTTTFTGSVSTSTSAVTVGANASGADPFTGYMDDVRITKGLARYTGSTYTTPTAPFPVQ